MKLRKKVVSTLDGVCGSGKTTAALKWIGNTELKTLYVCESTDLCNQVYDSLKNLRSGVIQKIINSKTNHRVSDEINHFIKEELDRYNVLIITWASYQQLDPIQLENFNYVFLDDIRQCVDFIELNLGEANFVLLRELSVINELKFKRQNSESTYETFECYELAFNASVKDIAEEIVTDYKETLMDLALKSRSHNLYIEKGKYDRLVNNEFDQSQTKKVNQRNVVTLYLSPKDELFPSNVVLVSEGITDCNQIGRILRNRGFELRPHIWMQRDVKNEFPVNKCKVNLYALSEDDITRYLLEKECEHEGYSNNADYLADISGKCMRDRKYIYIVNEHLQYKKIDSRFVNGERIQTINRGLNCYSHFHDVVCLTSMNLDNEKQNLLEFVDGIDYEASKRDGQMANDLQTIFRTAIRNVHSNPNKEIEINAIVPDQKTMLFLIEKMSPYYEVNGSFIEGYIPAKQRFDKADWNKSHYEENKEAVKEKYLTNKDSIRSKQKDYYQANKEALKQKRRERYLKKKAS